MSSFLYALAGWVIRARTLVVIVWVAIAALAGSGALLFNQGLDDGVRIPGTEAQEALDRLSGTFPQVSGETAQIIVLAPDGETIDDESMRGPIEALIDDLEAVDGVDSVDSPWGDVTAAERTDDDGTTLLTIRLDDDGGDVVDATSEALVAIAADFAETLPTGAESALGGSLFSFEFPGISVTEIVGVIVSFLVLLVALGSVIAAGLPIINALAGVVVAISLVFASTSFLSINSTTPLLAVMLGLAVGIDYALFIVSRHREVLRHTGGDRLEPDEAIARTVATAGSAVLFAGITTMIAILGLAVAGIPFLAVMGVAAAVAIGLAAVVSLTLLPALLSFAGERLRPKGPKRARRPQKRSAKVGAGAADAGETRGGRAEAPKEGRFFDAWVRVVTRKPALTVVLVLVGIAALALPALSLRLALPNAGTLPEDNEARQTFDLIEQEFGAGYNGPLIITGSIITSDDPVGLMEDLADEFRDMPGVVDVPTATPNPSADTGIIQVISTGAPDSIETEELVRDIRERRDEINDEYGFELAVTGFTATGIDVSTQLGRALIPFAIVVVGLSLVLMAMTFRSVAVPIKATLGYLLSVGAAFGAVALVFEFGFLADLLDVSRTGPVISFMPIVLMAILFGLAMDYQVFLVARIREEYVKSGDSRGAIRSGFRASGRVVMSAALIMFSVFVAFVPEGDMTLKAIALGLAVGVAVDAFVVRMTLVPAVLQLLGDRAWWIPRWVDRLLPSFDVEGDGLNRELQLTGWSGLDAATAAEGLTVERPDGSLLVGPVDVTVAKGAVQAFHSASPARVTATLLALTGRIDGVHGTIASVGLALPERASTVRTRTSAVDLRVESDPVAALSAAAAGADIVTLDRADSVSPAETRARLACAIRDVADAGTTVLLGAVGDPVDDLLPERAPRSLALPAPDGASAVSDDASIAEEAHA